MKNLNVSVKPQVKPQAKPQAENKPQAERVTLPESREEIAERLTALFAVSEKAEKVKVITKRQILNGEVSKEANGLGKMYSAVVKGNLQGFLLDFLEDQKSKGKKLNPEKVRVLLTGEPQGFNLFKNYLNDKEKGLTKFTANQTTGIFLRACLAD